ncbi:MAG TPA: thioredoxin-disulfide reductase [Anaerolineaceae bacterium]|nr:thioredoxin-disulfide reductase [Anaerolineaceae bacterium]HUM48699.1 thioredoxin-disulfide reductase [Anaerolineaceae bacterium]
MEATEHEKLIIIGGGPAGMTAALYAARAELQPVVFTGMTLYGQVSQTDLIENYPGFPEGITGMELGERLERQAARFGARIFIEPVESIDLQQKPFLVKTYAKSYEAETLILAMGADNKKLGVPGEAEFTGRGVSYCATCDGFFYRGKYIHVVGGGDSAIEEALFLTRFANSVTIIHRRDALRAQPLLEKRARSNPKIRFLWDTVVEEIKGQERVHSLSLRNLKTDQRFDVPTDGVFISIGHVPNTALIANQVELDDKGYVRIDWMMRTSVPGVFAAGEIADPHYRQIITSAAMGAAAALEADCYLNEPDL